MREALGPPWIFLGAIVEPQLRQVWGAAVPQEGLELPGPELSCIFPSHQVGVKGSEGVWEVRI